LVANRVLISSRETPDGIFCTNKMRCGVVFSMIGAEEVVGADDGAGFLVSGAPPSFSSSSSSSSLFLFFLACRFRYVPSLRAIISLFVFANDIFYQHKISKT